MTADELALLHYTMPCFPQDATLNHCIVVALERLSRYFRSMYAGDLPGQTHARIDAEFVLLWCLVRFTACALDCDCKMRFKLELLTFAGLRGRACNKSWELLLRIPGGCCR